ncbi:MAG: 4a-hydroxytetrahydrobiopterin dehydratase [Gammaproteobacteria bacterium]
MTVPNNSIANMRCEACRVAAPQVTEAEMARLLLQVPQWEILEQDGSKRLRRRFHFDSFSRALAFTNEVGAIAEEQGHHPTLLTEYGSVTVTWWSHKIGGLHVNDFIMAGKTDRLFFQHGASGDGLPDPGGAGAL